MFLCLEDSCSGSCFDHEIFHSFPLCVHAVRAHKPHLRESFVVPFSLLHMLHVLFQVWGGFRSGLHEFGVQLAVLAWPTWECQSLQKWTMLSTKLAPRGKRIDQHSSYATIYQYILIVHYSHMIGKVMRWWEMEIHYVGTVDTWHVRKSSTSELFFTTQKVASHVQISRKLMRPGTTTFALASSLPQMPTIHANARC